MSHGAWLFGSWLGILILSSEYMVYVVRCVFMSVGDGCRSSCVVRGASLRSSVVISSSPAKSWRLCSRCAHAVGVAVLAVCCTGEEIGGCGLQD